MSVLEEVEVAEEISCKTHPMHRMDYIMIRA
jgi:hypothetical protein